MTDPYRKPILLCARVDGTDRRVEREPIDDPKPPTPHTDRVPCGDCGKDVWLSQQSAAIMVPQTDVVCVPCAMIRLKMVRA